MLGVVRENRVFRDCCLLHIVLPKFPKLTKFSLLCTLYYDGYHGARKLEALEALGSLGVRLKFFNYSLLTPNS